MSVTSAIDSCEVHSRIGCAICTPRPLRIRKLMRTQYGILALTSDGQLWRLVVKFEPVPRVREYSLPGGGVAVGETKGGYRQVFTGWERLPAILAER